ncbi:MAG: sn-glycerol-3-phosphate ABC transporter ATP-binding protein UgpC [Spirochaetales bacterium]|nr:sn-glycerol-3-phosphate ABC transporter ATP-binding protein UgpC [Spirochaetales bacterium]
MASVTLKNIKKIYPPLPGKTKNKHKTEESKSNLQTTEKGIVAVQDFNIEIKDKEFIVLVGPSGCGKSTTLRMIAGLEEITEGELYIGDKLVNELEPKDRDIAMVFQNYALYPHMSVYDNMAFALKKKVKSKEEIKKKVMEAAEILGITEYLDRKPKNLSGGQRQRVAIGRAIVRNPKVMLMDEPLSNLDAKLRNQMRTELLRLRKKIDTTFVYVTHDQTEAMTLGDRIVVMKDGFIQQIGTPEEVFNSPRNVFVATFIGTPQMNLFDGTLNEIEDGYSLSIMGKDIILPQEMGAKLKEKGIKTKNVTVGIRPDSIEISNFDGLFEATIGVAELMGTSIHLHLEQGDRDIIAVIEAKDEHHMLRTFTPDSKIFYSFAPESMYLFDSETGLNMEC